MRYTIEYRPKLSNECLKYISNNVEPLFTNTDTDIYGLDYVYDTINFLFKENDGNPICGISNEDLSLIKDLISEDVSYIEF